MTRLTNELEQIHGEERQEAVEKIKTEYLQELTDMKQKYNHIEALLRDEVKSLKKTLNHKQKELEEVQARADTQLVQARMYMERTEREHQNILDREVEERELVVSKCFVVFGGAMSRGSWKIILFLYLVN